MDRMLVVVFDSENKAYEGKKALSQLESEGSIAVYAYAVIGKNPDGTTTLKQGDDPGPLGTLVWYLAGKPHRSSRRARRPRDRCWGRV